MPGRSRLMEGCHWNDHGMANVTTCGELLHKNVGMSNAYDLGSKVLFNANVVKKLDECGGTKFGIDINSKTLESPELMSLSLGRILNNAHSSSYMYTSLKDPPPNIP